MKNKPSLLTIIIYIFFLSLLSSLILIYQFQKKLGPNLIICAERDIKHLTTLVINNSIRKYHKKINTNNLLEYNNTNKEIALIHYNVAAINHATIELNKLLEKDLENMIKGNFKDIQLKLNTITEEQYEKINNGIIFTISSGALTKNSLLANIGPKIPLKLSLVENINTNIKPKVTEYGLNNCLVEIYAEVKTTISIQMPFLSKEITIQNKIPLTMEIIQGKLPEYYIGKH